MKFNKVIFDMDGVVYLGRQRIGNAHFAIDALRRTGVQIAFLTNNATRSRVSIVKKLASFGIQSNVGEVMCSSYAAATYASNLKPKPKTAYIIGEAGLKEELELQGIKVLGESECKNSLADIFVIGLDRQFTYKKLEMAYNHIIANKPFIATNLDNHYPWSNGSKPGGGAAIAALSFAAGKAIKTTNKISSIRPREPDFVAGKPNVYMLNLLLAGQSKKSTALVGDRLDMDIELANRAGLFSILVLSGITSKEQAKKARGIKKPKAILSSIMELPVFLS